jgi:holo-[acyl-carrier protein] synthase
MVRGIGVDIIEIARIRRNIETGKDGFLQKIFTDQEIAYCRTMHHADQHFAARFAAKEAVSKALSTGWSGEFRWKDVEILNDPAGQPHVMLHGALRQTLGGASILLSMSHSESHVVAMALIQDSTGSS